MGLTFPLTMPNKHNDEVCFMRLSLIWRRKVNQAVEKVRIRGESNAEFVNLRKEKILAR